MKKILLRLLIAIVVLAILAVLAAALLLDRAIRAGVETIGPKVTKTDVKLESASLSLLSGSGKIKGLLIGNPEGFKAPSAVSIGAASFAVVPRSLLADKIIVRSIHIEGPEITFETDLHANNLSKLIANVQAAEGSVQTAPSKAKEPASPQQAKPSKRLEVDDFLISGGKVHVSVTALGGRSATVALPEIHLEPLGQGPEGITAAELVQRVLVAIQKEAEHASANTVAEIAKGALYLTKDPTKLGTNTVEKATKGLGDLFKRK